MLAQSTKSVRNFSFLERIKILTIATLGYVLVWLINLTVRYQYLGGCRFEEPRRNGGVILSFWHNQIFMATYAFRFKGIMAMTSRAFDGEYIARIIRAFGYSTARGSSSRGSVAALLEMKRQLQSGHVVGFPIDGPRGPRYKVKPGPLWLSAKVGRPILCFHVQPASYWELRSWDRFRIPKPFTTATVRLGRLLQVPQGVDPASLLPAYQEEMDRLRRVSEREAGAPDSS